MVLVNNNVGLAGCNTQGAAKRPSLPCSDRVETRRAEKTGQENEEYALIAGFRRKTISTMRRRKLDPAIANSDKACRCDWTKFHGTEMVLAMGADHHVCWSAETPPKRALEKKTDVDWISGAGRKRRVIPTQAARRNNAVTRQRSKRRYEKTWATRPADGAPVDVSIPNARVNKPAKGERLEISVFGEGGPAHTALTEEKIRARGQAKAFLPKRSDQILRSNRHEQTADRRGGHLGLIDTTRQDNLSSVMQIDHPC